MPVDPGHSQLVRRTKICFLDIELVRVCARQLILVVYPRLFAQGLSRRLGCG